VLDVRKILVVSITQRSEELILYNVVRYLAISNPDIKAVQYLDMCIPWLNGSFVKLESRPFQ
jgi:hypothetical protein